jgi:signal transduction histidine kinase
MDFDQLISLRRGLRDLVTLTALPAIWAEYQPHDIAKSLSEVLLTTLHLDLVYIYLTHPHDSVPLELVRTNQWIIVGEEAQSLGKIFSPWLSTDGSNPIQSIPDPLADGVLQIVVNPIGANGSNGYVVAGIRSLNAWGEVERLLLSVAVNQAATALQQARLLADFRAADQLKDTLLANEQTARAQAEAAQKRMHFLEAASATLASTLDYETALENICQLTVPTIADSCTIMLFQPDGHVRAVNNACGKPEHLDILTAIQKQIVFDPNGSSATANVLHSGKSLLITDFNDSYLEVYAEDADHLSFLRQLDLQSVMVVALQTRDQILGAITFNMSESGRHYDADDLVLAEELAGRVATAIDRARLYKAEQRARETLQTRVRLQSYIAELGQEALVSVDVPTLMDHAASVLAQALDIEFAKILEYFPEQGNFLLKAGIGWREGLVGREIVSGGLESQGGYAMMSHIPVIVEDLRTETRFHGAELLLSHGVVSGISVLIEGYGRPWGILGVHTAQRHTFTADDIYFVQSVANILGAALERARWYAQAQETATVQERQRIARELHDAVTQTLFSASLMAETLPNIWERQPEKGLQQTRFLHQLTRSAAAEMRVLLVELRPESIISAKLGDLLTQLGYGMQGRRSIEVSTLVRGDSEQPLPPEVQVAVYRIAQESLNNIIKHGGAKRARIKYTRSKTQVTLVITDNGHGFDPRAPSTGFGLLSMQERANAIGVSLKINSKIGVGTCIRLVWNIPQEY